LQFGTKTPTDELIKKHPCFSEGVGRFDIKYEGKQPIGNHTLITENDFFQTFYVQNPQFITHYNLRQYPEDFKDGRKPPFGKWKSMHWQKEKAMPSNLFCWEEFCVFVDSTKILEGDRFKDKTYYHKVDCPVSQEESNSTVAILKDYKKQLIECQNELSKSKKNIESYYGDTIFGITDRNFSIHSQKYMSDNEKDTIKSAKRLSSLDTKVYHIKSLIDGAIESFKDGIDEFKEWKSGIQGEIRSTIMGSDNLYSLNEVYIKRDIIPIIEDALEGESPEDFNIEQCKWDIPKPEIE
jgi:hypothetical protein